MYFREREREWKHENISIKNVYFIIVLFCVSIHTTIINTHKGGHYFFPPFITFLFHFFLYFSYTFAFRCKMHHGKWSGSSFLGIRPLTYLINLFYPLFVEFSSVWGVFRLGCSIFSEYDLAISFFFFFFMLFLFDIFDHSDNNSVWWILRSVIPWVGTNLTDVYVCRTCCLVYSFT